MWTDGGLTSRVCGRLSRDGTLVIDGGEEVKGSSKGPLQVLNVQGNIFFGKRSFLLFPSIPPDGVTGWLSW